ncbi:MAG: carbohydrate ABC transporter permease [Beutenbergiaceae bacterium]
MTLTAAAPQPAPSGSTGSPPPRRQRPGKRKSSLLSILLILCALYFLTPLVWLFISTTKTNSDLFNTFGLWIGTEFNLIENLRAVFSYNGGIFWRWILNTILYAVVTAFITSLICMMAGWVFAKYTFPGKRLAFSVILGAVMIPLTAIAVPTYLLFSYIQVVNTPWAVILPSLVNPLGVYLMMIYAQDAVPDSLVEAARIDGAGEFRILFRVCFPMLIPGIVTVFLFALVGTWNNYLLPLIMLSDTGLFPLTVGVAQWQDLATGGVATGGQPLFAMVITASGISVLPLIIAFLYLQRYWQSGLATGAIKA